MARAKVFDESFASLVAKFTGTRQAQHAHLRRRVYAPIPQERQIRIFICALGAQQRGRNANRPWRTTRFQKDARSRWWPDPAVRFVESAVFAKLPCWQ